MISTFDDGPSAEDLAAIEAEWPQIEQDLADLDAEIRALGVSPDPGWGGYRRAESMALATVTDLVNRRRHDCLLHLVETGMSDCRYGCKVLTCTKCFTGGVVHNSTYGCRAGQAAA
ncbi:DUF6284 family protein [Catenuloplanes japonicus]|uniref:DUF6284 family protein n=1 Tax=Catenuloplanes japonicus TaxID=33876 RepID=UPI00068E1B91|nr:DUF6284 family protein [Catenuloplanes japonicus]